MKIVYYSVSGNTKMMAEFIKEGIEEAGKQVELVNVESANVDEIANEDILILGCPSCGVEELDGDYMEPFVQALEGKINNKAFALFGSFDWGEGDWMQEWENRMTSFGGKLVTESLIVREAPEAPEDIEACKMFGRIIGNQ